VSIIESKPRAMSYLLPEGPGEKGGFSDSKFAKWFVQFDENKLRPFLIRNYTIENVVLQDVFNDLITKEFDAANPEEMESAIEEVSQITRKMSISNQALLNRKSRRFTTNPLTGSNAAMMRSFREEDTVDVLKIEETDPALKTPPVSPIPSDEHQLSPGFTNPLLTSHNYKDDSVIKEMEDEEDVEEGDEIKGLKENYF
jgi:hypothetical protein